jgi:hypothetical protein
VEFNRLPAMKRPVDTETLKQFFCFIELTQEEARVVAGLLGKIDLKSGRHCSGEGTLAPPCMGEVQIRIEGSNGSPHTLVTLGPGAILGEMGPLTNEPRGATSVAVADTHLAELPINAFRNGLERSDRWATKFLMATARVLAQRLAALNKETISMMAQLEKSRTQPKPPVEDELERLRRRLLTEWTF